MEMNMKMDFGWMLAEARSKAGLTQNQLAQMSGVSDQIISDLEHNQLKEIPEGVMVSLHEILGLDEDTIKLWNELVETLGNKVEAMRVVKLMSFSMALEAMKRGECVNRLGWNGKGMYIYITSAKIVKRQIFQGHGPDPLVNSKFIVMCTASGSIIPWLASQSDLLADDWCVVVAGKGEPYVEGELNCSATYTHLSGKTITCSLKQGHPGKHKGVHERSLMFWDELEKEDK